MLSTSKGLSLVHTDAECRALNRRSIQRLFSKKSHDLLRLICSDTKFVPALGDKLFPVLMPIDQDLLCFKSCFDML